MANLEFVYSSMNSGKSLSLITKHYMLIQKGFNVLVFKPELDVRSSFIETRIGLKVECIHVKNDEKISDVILKSNRKKPDYILCDESQFFNKEQIWDLANLVDNWNINVICYGLRIDWTGNFFEGSGELMKISDKLTAIENLCETNKGALAYFHIKHGDNLKDSVEVGYEDKYTSVSRKVWNEWYKGVNNDNESDTHKK